MRISDWSSDVCSSDLTPSHAVRTYDFDVMSGTIANCRILHQFPLGRGRPDGASVDVEGCYLTALFDGGRVVRLSPDGAILAEIPLPATRPTMRSEEHTSELQSLIRPSYAVFCSKKKPHKT